jgi:IMP dehydrogenase
MTAPMASVINDENYLKFDAEGIMTVIPRTVPLSKRLEIMKNLVFIAVGLDEFRMIINDYQTFPEGTKICLDVANGHMEQVIDLCKEAKNKFGSDLEIMTGNIANPATYLEYAKAGIDYCRLGIGSGNACSTSYLSGIHLSMDRLIRETFHKKQYVQEYYTRYKSIPKIVADGGFQSIRQIIIALAMGADYVMLGQMMAATEEACGDKVKLASGWHREYYGMSTERAQKEMGNTKIKPAEGIEKLVPIEYTVKDWVKEFVRVIESTMSYCNAKFLDQFIGKVQVQKASEGEYLSYEKSKYI